MKSNIIKITAALLVTVVIAGVSIWQVKFNKDWREEYAYAKGIEALVYAFPYFLDSALLYKWSLPQVPENNKGPANAINQFWQSPELTNPKDYRDGGMPNRDTLYSVAWVYSDTQPLIISVPAHPDERYYSFEFAGFDSDNFAYIGKRTHGNGAGNYAVTPPGWQGELPEGVTFLAENPTPWFFLLGRTMVQPGDAQDEALVHALVQDYKITALGDWGQQNPPRPPFPAIKDVGALSEMLADSNIIKFLKKMMMSEPMLFWEMVNHAMTVNGVPKRDQSRLTDWAGLNIGPNQDLSKLSDSEKAGLERAVFDGIMMLRNHGTQGFDSKNVNGWKYPAPSIGRAGINGNYATRSALQSMKGIVANDPEEAVYIPISKDQNGDLLNGKHNYKIHFTKEQLPPAKEFWSLTAYDDDGNMVLNPIDRYMVSDRSEHLVYDSEGGLTLYVGAQSPQGNESNWLPAETEATVLMIRIYGPTQAVIDQSWMPPAIQKI